MKNKIPTLNEAINHVKKHGGHFKGKNGRVEYSNEDQALPTAEQLLGESPFFSESEEKEK